MLHGKAALWQQPNVHYHTGLAAGALGPCALAPWETRASRPRSPLVIQSALNSSISLSLRTSGDNTLNGQLAKLLLRTVAADGEYQTAAYLQRYAEFLTTPGSHNDSYADTAHVQFVYNFGEKPDNPLHP